MAWGEAPVIVPTTAWYVTEVAVLLVTDAEHVVPFPQDATALLLLSRITMYHGVEVMSPLVVAVRVTPAPVVSVRFLPGCVRSALTVIVPLLTGETLAALISTHARAGAVSTVLTAVVDDPSGYGRVLRDSASNEDRRSRRL